MNQTQETVINLPIEELWAGKRLISTIMVRDLNAAQIEDLLRLGDVRFVVAEVDRPLQWIPNNESCDFWKEQVVGHLATLQGEAVSNQCPDSHWYVASEWESYDGETIILLSKAH